MLGFYVIMAKTKQFTSGRMKYRTDKIYIGAGKERMKLLILSPTDDNVSRTGILWIHGGGYFTGMAEMVHFSRAKNLVAKYGAVVVSPEYTLSGRSPYPAALTDCHRALVYLRDNAEKLGVGRDRIMVGGESAGGGLAAALCMYEKDTHGVNIAFQMPLYPMIDNEDTETSRGNHAPVWNTRRNRFGWNKYLRGLVGDVPCYAAPARRTDYSSLPPAYTFVSTAEPFYAETAAYIENLKNAGVEARLDVYPGLYHAFDMLTPFRRESKLAARKFEEEYLYARENYFAEN